MIPWNPMLHLWKSPKQCPPDFPVSTDCCVQLRGPFREMSCLGDLILVYAGYYLLPPYSQKVEIVNMKCPWSQAQDPSLGKSRIGVQITNLKHELEAALVFPVSELPEEGRLWEESYIFTPLPFPEETFLQRKAVRESNSVRLSLKLPLCLKGDSVCWVHTLLPGSRQKP